MIQIICGPKGSGKTKKIIDAANAATEQAKGLLMFITDTKRYMYDLKRDIRVIDVTDYNVAGKDAFCGFIKGAIASDYDYEYVFVDGVSRITGRPLAELQELFYTLEKIATERNLKITFTCSCPQEELPDFIAKYL